MNDYIHFMLGPSGFFITNGPEDLPIFSDDLELIHSSEDGFNVLYRGSKNGRFFVYKALKSEFRGNPLYEELQKKEFDIGFSMTHHGICQYYGLVILPDLGSCIVMEWIDGCSLESLIASGEIDDDMAVKIIEELCDALDYMHHKQVIHRDLKPENILITHNGRNVKIIDFGLSDADAYNAFKAPAGTRVYASPELLAGESIDNRSDIWSLGVIINEVSGRYRSVAGRCLRRDRNRRFSNALEVRKYLRLHSRRRLFRHLIFVAIALLAVSGLLYMSVNGQKDHLETDGDIIVPDTLEQMQQTLQEPVFSSETPASESRPKVKAAESIDSATLDDLFEEASEIIL